MKSSTSRSRSVCVRKKPRTFINGAGMTLRRVSPGTFQFGDVIDRTVPGIDGYSLMVDFAYPFYMSETHVTLAQWRTVMGDTEVPSNIGGDPQLPVTGVTPDQAFQFCDALAKLDAAAGKKRSYDLATEAEWEYCARAGTHETMYCDSGNFGLARDWRAELAEHEWFADNSGGVVHPVAQLKPNPWGFFDMLGNVCELTRDAWSPELQVTDPLRDPRPLQSQQYAVRGGCWFDDDCRDLVVHKRFGVFAYIPQGYVGLRIVWRPRSRKS